MTRPTTPYSKYLGDRDPLDVMRETLGHVESLFHGWASDRFELSYAPGKWSARQILTHLAQTELALGLRVRFALTTPNYAAQPFDQDLWVALESQVPGRTALEAFLALARMDRLLFQSLSPAQRAIPFAHPEYGSLTVDWVIHQIAGHQVHHLRQLEQIG